VTLAIERVEATLLRVPWDPVHGPHMERLAADFSLVEVYAIYAGGVVGYGESLIQQATRRASAARLEALRGRNVYDLLWDDALGDGLQQALWDAAGKAAGVPVHRLLGAQVRDRCKIAWWCRDMPAEDWASEAQRATAAGYRALKLKGRPWRDVLAQVKAVAAVLPSGVRLDIDFNSSLATTAEAVPYLQRLQEQPHVAIVETPIPQGDVAGNREIRSKVRLPIAMHFGNPPIMTALREDVCDGFVVAGRARGVLRQATLAAEANKPFWLQLMGTGITTAWMLQLGAICSHAQWPGVTIMNAYADDLLAEPLRVQEGYIPVPAAPGLGVEVDREALQRYRLAENVTPPRRRQLNVVAWPAESGAPARRTTYAGDEEALRRDFELGNEPRFVPGVQMAVEEDDGSARFDALYRRASTGPVRETQISSTAAPVG
jgi:L-alanine-DL-glutamate epimerase-like enolase superfamily enzyme